MPRCPACGVENEPGTLRCRGCLARLPRGGKTGSPDQAPPLTDAQLDEVLAALRAQKKIEAIKLYREATDLGLKDSKDAVEALAKQHGIAARGSGCAASLLVAAALGATALAAGWAWAG